MSEYFEWRGGQKDYQYAVELDALRASNAELLEACKATIGVFQRLLTLEPDLLDKHIGIGAVSDQLRAVIAKAEGKADGHS